MPVQISGSLLYKLGEALHTLQDSWSHQGVPETPQIAGNLFECDSARSWSHSRLRGGWNSHKADHTMPWPADTRAMAKATFDTLTLFPPIMGEARSPRSWEQIQPALDGFIKASTKSEKRDWFVSHGILDVAFLGDTTLKDGTRRFDLRWSQRKLPRLPSMSSRQHQVDGDVLEFFSRLFASWISSDDLDGVARAFGAAALPRASRADGRRAAMEKAELAARLKLWRLRDHGIAAELAHAASPLTPNQIASANALGRAPDAYVRYEAPTDALFPLVPPGKDASPLLPFIVNEATPSNPANRRFVATAKFRHAPYDIVGVVAEGVAGQWKVLSIVSAVDH